MKSYIKISGLLLSVAFLAILTSCEKEEMTEVAMGKLELSIAVGEDLKSALTDSNDITTYHVLLSVVNSLGELILDDELIPLYRFGNQFISEKIERKLMQYLNGLKDAISSNQAEKLKNNLPKKYHLYIEESLKKFR